MNALSLMNSLFEDLLPSNLMRRDLLNQDFDRREMVWKPRVDLHEEKDKYVLSIDLPGMKEKDVKIEFRDGILSISGQRSEERESKEGDNYYYQERVFGRFERSFNFGNNVDEDKISAMLREGILKVDLGKKEQKKGKLVTISSN